jgi:hypothetical protein
MNKRQLLALAVASLLTLGGRPGSVFSSHMRVANAAGPTGLRVLNLSGAWVRGVVALGDLNQDGVDDIVVGGSDGKVYAYRGTGAKLWEYDTGNAAIEGKAAIGDIDGDGWNEVLIGVGSTFTPNAPGGVYAFTHDGGLHWFYASRDFDHDGIPDAVRSSPALADVDGNDNGRLEIVYGGYDGYIRVLNDDGSMLWESFVRDSIWCSPAIGDVDHDGRLEIAIGVDSHWEPAYGTQDGGMLYVLNGENGSVLPGFPKQTDEVIWSSPALADLNSDGWLDIVVGTGNCWSDPVCAPGGRTHPTTKALYGWDHNGNPLPGWPVQLSDYAFASPALGDLDEDGDLEVVVNTNDGYVHAFHANGTPAAGWPRLVTTPVWPPPSVVHYATNASPLLADLTGNGYLEVILPSNWEVVVWDRTGNQLTRPLGTWTLSTSYTVASTPAVGDVDNDGKKELVVGGALQNGYPGAIYVWDFNDLPASAPAPWPSFRRDPLNHARYSLPQLSVFPSSLLVMHEYGSGSSATGHLWVINKGEGQIEWQVDSKPAQATLAPGSGTVGPQSQIIDVTISTTKYGPGTYSLGDIEISGTQGGEVVMGSPANIPVTLYVGKVHRSFFPLILRGH